MAEIVYPGNEHPGKEPPISPSKKAGNHAIGFAVLIIAVGIAAYFHYQQQNGGGNQGQKAMSQAKSPWWQGDWQADGNTCRLTLDENGSGRLIRTYKQGYLDLPVFNLQQADGGFRFEARWRYGLNLVEYFLIRPDGEDGCQLYRLNNGRNGYLIGRMKRLSSGKGTKESP